MLPTLKKVSVSVVSLYHCCMKKMFLVVAARNDSVNSTSLQSNKSNTSTLYSERYAQVLIYKQVVLVNQQDLLGLYMFARHDM